jgi:hypothetical protein
LDFSDTLTFELLDQSFQNLVANFGATRDITRSVHLFKSKMAATGRLQSWIFEITITVKPLDRSFQNLMANFESTRDIIPVFLIFKNPRWRPQAGGHLRFLRRFICVIQIPITFKLLDRSIQNFVANFESTRATTRNVQIF